MNRPAAIFVLVLSAATSASRASFTDLPLRADYVIRPDATTDPTTFGYSKTVGSGVEFPAFPTDSPGYEFGDTPTFDVDVADASIHVANFDSSDTFADFDFNGLVFTDSSSQIAPFTSFTVDASQTTLAGLDASRLSFDDDHLRVNWAGLSFTPSTVVELRVTFGTDPTTPPSIPEPTGLAVGLTTVCLTLRARRQRRA